jgi:hypothetical protein
VQVEETLARHGLLYMPYVLKQRLVGEYEVRMLSAVMYVRRLTALCCS